MTATEPWPRIERRALVARRTSLACSAGAPLVLGDAAGAVTFYDESLVPQGGGHPSGHRCPGESVALRLLMATAKRLAGVDYEVSGPAQVDLSRIPTLPMHGLRLTEVSSAAVS